MQKLACWTLATLYSIAITNRPTPTEVAKFKLTGWEETGYLDVETNRVHWSEWVNSTWSVDLGAHSTDTWLYTDPTTPQQIGKARGYTLYGTLWTVTSGHSGTVGEFLSDILGWGYCSEYPVPTPKPEPTHTPPVATPAPTPYRSYAPERTPRLTQTFQPTLWPTPVPARTLEPTPQQTPKPTPHPTQAPVVLSNTAWVEPFLCGVNTATNTRELLGNNLDFLAWNPFKGTRDGGIAYTAAKLDSSQYLQKVAYQANSFNTLTYKKFKDVVTSSNTHLKGNYTLLRSSDMSQYQVDFQVLLPDWMLVSNWVLEVDTNSVPWARLTYNNVNTETYSEGSWVLFPSTKVSRSQKEAQINPPVFADNNKLLPNPTVSLYVQNQDGYNNLTEFSTARPNDNSPWASCGYLSELKSNKSNIRAVFSGYTFNKFFPGFLVLDAQLPLGELGYELAVSELTTLEYSFLAGNPGGPSAVSLPPNGGYANYYVVGALNWNRTIHRDYTDAYARILALPLKYANAN